MCGLTGCVFNNVINFDHKQFKKINDLISHRGPDYKDTSFFKSADKNVYFGHNRLSIIDLNKTGNQPMESQNNRFTIIFNGEIYNHKELRDFLISNYNITFKGTSDTEILLEYFVKSNIHSFFDKIEGMFSFAIFDKNENTLHLARDRAGEKPMYIYFNKDFFGFSSDLSTIINFPNFKKNINQKGLSKYINYNYIPSPYTIFENCFKLPQSTYLKINFSEFRLQEVNSFENIKSINGIYVKKYWTLNNNNKLHNKDSLFNYDQKVNKLDKLITNSVNNQLISDVPIGTFLSGGIDSSLITSIVKKNILKPNTFTIGFDFNEYDESLNAEKISKYLGTNHHSYTYKKNDLIDTIHNIPFAYSEPFADSSQLPTMLISKIASENVKVVLTGDGGDEIFGGYNRYVFYNNFKKYLNFFNPELRKKLINFFKFFPKKIQIYLLSIILKTNLNHKKLNKIMYKIENIHDDFSYYYSMISQWSNEDQIIEITNDEKYVFSNYFEKEHLSSEESMMFADFENYLTDDILCKVDRAAMYYSLETRTPYLNKELVEFMFNNSLNDKIHNGKSKILLKSVLNKYLPENLISKEKYGFAIPIAYWIKHDLKNWVNEILSEEEMKKHNYFNYKIVNKIKSEHFNGYLNHEHKLWALIQFNLWYNSFIK